MIALTNVPVVQVFFFFLKFVSSNSTYTNVIKTETDEGKV